MTELTKKRVESIDMLKGIVMVIMALDHVRDFFHADSFRFEPTDLSHTSIPLFLTRLASDFCAPAFCLLAGTSAYFVGRKKSKADLSRFLLTRGAWLVFIEVTIVTFAWFFNIKFRTIELQVIWSLGVSMLCLAGIIHLPFRFILLFGGIMIFTHNMMDHIHFEGNLYWSMLHEQLLFPLTSNTTIEVYYPLVPWIGVMAVGYCLGRWYEEDPSIRKRKLQKTAFVLMGLFILFRGFNIYGDPAVWSKGVTSSITSMSFLNLTKYPPSLLFLLFTLSGVLISLSLMEGLKCKLVKFFSVFGRVPFFYYIIHLYFIHLLAMMAAEFTGFGWQRMICSVFVNYEPGLKGYGFSLSIVYLIWIGVVLAMYPLCKKFDAYKSANKQKTWLSYL